MKPKWIVAIVVGCVAVVLGGALLIGYTVLRDRDAVDAAALAKERELDRAEAAAAFKDATPATKSDNDAFLPTLDALGRDLVAGNAAGITNQFDTDRMVRECARQGLFEKLGIEMRLSSRRDFGNGIKAGMGKALAGKKEMFSWDQTELRRVRWSADGSEAVVIARHRNSVGDDVVWFPVRWWMINTGGTWRVYDFEDLNQGSRMSALMAAAASPALINNPGPFQQQTQAVQQALVLFAAGDIDGADKALQPARVGKALPFVAALRDVIEGLICVGRGDGQKALRFFDAADAAQPDMPMVLMGRAMAYNLLARHEEALAVGRKYTDALGPTAVVLLQVGYALEELKRPNEAIAAYRLALDDDPNDEDVFPRLRDLLKKGSLKELAERLVKRKMPEDEFTGCVFAAYAAEDFEAAEAIIAAYRKLRPDDFQGLQQSVNLALRRKRPGEAVKYFKEALAQKVKDRRDAVMNFARLFAAQGQAQAAYANTPAADQPLVFRGALFSLLTPEDEDDYDTRPAAERAKDLDELIAARTKDEPNDPWIAYARGYRATVKQDWAAAEKEYDAVLKALSPNDLDREAVVGNQLDVYYHLKRAVEGFEKLGPTPEHFESIAWRYGHDNDGDGLQKLYAAHEKANPTHIELGYWRGEIAWLNKKYPAAVAEYRSFLNRVKDEEKNSRAWGARDRLVRSLIRDGKSSEALKFVGGLPDDAEGSFSVLRPLVTAATGDVAATLEYLRSIGTANWWFIGQCYSDEDLGPLLVSDKFLEVRKQFREPAPYPREAK